MEKSETSFNLKQINYQHDLENPNATETCKCHANTKKQSFQLTQKVYNYRTVTKYSNNLKGKIENKSERKKINHKKAKNIGKIWPSERMWLNP